MVHGQAFHPVPESSNWPGAYHSAGVLVWMAVVFLGADAVVEAVPARVAAPGPSSGPVTRPLVEVRRAREASDANASRVAPGRRPAR